MISKAYAKRLQVLPSLQMIIYSSIQKKPKKTANFVFNLMSIINKNERA